jgi:hypothetical protein
MNNDLKPPGVPTTLLSPLPPMSGMVCCVHYTDFLVGGPILLRLALIVLFFVARPKALC